MVTKSFARVPRRARAGAQLVEEQAPEPPVDRSPVVRIDQQLVPQLVALVQIGHPRRRAPQRQHPEGTAVGRGHHLGQEREERLPEARVRGDTPGRLEDVVLPRRIAVHPARVALGLAQGFHQVAVEALARDRPRAHERLEHEELLVVVGRARAPVLVEQRAPVGDEAAPVGRHSRECADTRTRVGAPLRVVRGRGQQRARPVALPALARGVELVDGEPEAIRVAADLVEREQARVPVHRGVLDTLGHDRARRLLEPHDERQAARRRGGGSRRRRHRAGAPARTRRPSSTRASPGRRTCGTRGAPRARSRDVLGRRGAAAGVPRVRTSPAPARPWPRWRRPRSPGAGRWRRRGRLARPDPRTARRRRSGTRSRWSPRPATAPAAHPVPRSSPPRRAGRRRRATAPGSRPGRRGRRRGRPAHRRRRRQPPAPAAWRGWSRTPPGPRPAPRPGRRCRRSAGGHPQGRGRRSAPATTRRARTGSRRTPPCGWARCRRRAGAPRRPTRGGRLLRPARRRRASGRRRRNRGSSLRAPASPGTGTGG